ncbi:hypothetical protein [Balneola sp. EhC07]|uniref:hypothetical protein n=1 Tax=Balneola sp. EhC07 TaxID=1849360 RepID=UPI0013732A91|nr:hypothetical protein [Balneola sp. EhC07]
MMVIKENEELMKTSFSFAWLFFLKISKPLTITFPIGITGKPLHDVDVNTGN